jgi:hypothetical protein
VFAEALAKAEAKAVKKNKGAEAWIYSKPVSRTLAGLCTIAVTCFSLAGTEHF